MRQPTPNDGLYNVYCVLGTPKYSIPRGFLLKNPKL